MADVFKTLVNKTDSRLTINFLGAFPNNKWANPNGKIYLTEPEYDWCTVNIPKWLEDGTLVEAGTDEDKPVKTSKDIEAEYKEFFSQHHNTVKSEISKIEDLDYLDKLIDYGNDHEDEVSPKILDALTDRYNELSE